MGIFDVPEIADYVQLSPLELHRKVLRDPKLPKVVDGVDIKGFYDQDDDVIYISDQVDMGSWEAQGFLIHEKEHREQYKQGLDKLVKCRNELEMAAYKAEAAYLQEHGQISERSFNKLMEHAKKVSQCH